MQNLKKYIPLWKDLSSYTKGKFKLDLVSGLTVGVMLVPQGMAYAYLAGMPPIYGLYAGLLPLMVYAIFGSSRHLSIGPVAVSALLVFAGLSELAEPLSAKFVELAILTCFLVGALQLLLGLFRLGWLANFISQPVISGFTSAAALVVIISQLTDFLGVSVEGSSNPIEKLWQIILRIPNFNGLSLTMSLAALALLLVFKKWSKRWPSALLIVVLATLASWLLNLEEKGVKVVGHIPSGLPDLAFPILSKETFYQLLPTVFTVTAISIVESLSIAKFYEGKSKGYRIMNNQELFALGFANLLGSVGKSMPTSGSFSRSAINYHSGAKTGISSLITVLVVVLALVFLTPLFQHLPLAVLAAIILVAVIHLLDYKEAIRLWRVHKRDFVMLMSTFVGTLFLGIEMGVLIGFGLSIATVLYRSSKPNVAVLGRVKGTHFFRSTSRHADLTMIPNTTIARFDDQLYYGNAYYFKDKLSQLLIELEDGQTLILDASNVHDIDSTGLTVLEDLKVLAAENGVNLCLCNLVEQVEDVLQHAKLIDVEDGIVTFNSIHEATENLQQT